MFQREHSSRAEVMYFVIAFFLFSLRLPSMHVALQPTWCWSIAFRLSPPLSSVLVATVSYRMQWSSPSPRGLHPFTTPHSSLSFPDICLKKKMQSLRFSSLFHRFFLICLLSQEKIPISLTPFLTRKIHNVSLCSFFFLFGSCLLSAPLTKRGGSVTASTQHSPSIIFSLLFVSSWGRCSRWKTVTGTW